MFVLSYSALLLVSLQVIYASPAHANRAHPRPPSIYPIATPSALTAW